MRDARRAAGILLALWVSGSASALAAATAPNAAPVGRATSEPAAKPAEARALKGVFVCGAQAREAHKGHLACVKHRVPVFFRVEENGNSTAYLVIGAREGADGELKSFAASKALQKDDAVELTCEVLPAADGLPARLIVRGEEWILKREEGGRARAGGMGGGVRGRAVKVDGAEGPPGE